MSDGNTGIQVAPVTKEEAMNLQGIFSKVAQALVDASSLPDQVKALQAQVNDLQDSLSRKTTHAEELDKSLSEVRQQRDEARNEAQANASRVAELSRSLEGANSIIDGMNKRLADQGSELDKARHDRDEYGLQVLSLEDQVKAWKEKADKARTRLNDVLSVFKQDEPEAKPEPVPEPSPEPAPQQAAPSPQPEPEPQPSSAPSPAMQSDQGQSAASPTVPAQSTETGQSAQSSGVNETGDVSQPTTTSSSADGPRYSRDWEPGGMWDEGAGMYRFDH